MRPYLRIEERTKEMEGAIYLALDSIDAYLGVIREILDEEESSTLPNPALVGRLRQFQNHGETMVRIIEDDVLGHLMFCLDRLFSVRMAEDEKFI